MRRAAPTRALALPGFSFFSTTFPPLLGACGTSPTCETNCFSVGNYRDGGAARTAVGQFNTTVIDVDAGWLTGDSRRKRCPSPLTA
jgi:hypothetical protein